MKFWRRKLKWVLNMPTRSSRREFTQIISDLESGGDVIDDDPIRSSSPKTTREWVVIFKEELQAEEKQDIARPNQCILSYSNSRLDWVIRLKEELNRTPPWEEDKPWLSRCIFKVPENLRELEPMSYEPNTVSIGPYHRGNTRVKDMEQHKWRFLRQVLKRTKHDVELYLLAMSKLEQQTRQCYTETVIAMDSREFIEMMLLDACFVLEILRTTSCSSVKGRFRRYGYSKGDPIFNSPRLLPSIKNDMLKLENQLPLFVLRELFKITSSPDETGSVTQLALHFFNSPVFRPSNHGPYSIKNMERKGLHLLHVFRNSILPLGTPPDEPGNKELQSQFKPMIHSVTQLKNSGIKVRKKESDVFMDIHYKNGLLKIPPLLINSSTESIFLNLMAFEQCYPFCRNYVTSYANFMDRLINSTQDVEYLHLKGIIHHRLGSEEDVALLFNRLCRQIVFDVNDCYLSQVTSDVTKYLERSWPKYRTTLNHEYFRHPWAFVSFFAAAFLILLTFLQTLYAILGYHIPHS
ncbi:UPF0481 protein At3g47200-like [Tasmannia lanceolata]|uniref:UPF0481 protein At3g47200-like n=1 Tax=Tasmannia lanceolata TaxID=3420 RepID=UPI004062C216